MLATNTYEPTSDPFEVVEWCRLDTMPRRSAATRRGHLIGAAKLVAHRVRSTAARGGDVVCSLRGEVTELVCQALTLKHYPHGIDAAIRDLGEEVGVPDVEVRRLVGEIDAWLEGFRIGSEFVAE